MSLMIENKAPPLRIDEAGVIRIGSSKLTLDLIVDAYLAGQTPESIAEGYPSITLAEVYATIAYYLDHRKELDEYLEEGRRRFEELKKQIQSDPANQALRAKIIQRAREKGLR